MFSCGKEHGCVVVLCRVAFHEDEGTHKTETSRQNKTISRDARLRLSFKCKLSACGLTNADQYVHAHSLWMWISLHLSLFLCLSVFTEASFIAQKLLFHSSKDFPAEKTSICCVLDAGGAIKLFNQQIIPAQVAPTFTVKLVKSRTMLVFSQGCWKSQLWFFFRY